MSGGRLVPQQPTFAPVVGAANAAVRAAGAWPAIPLLAPSVRRVDHGGRRDHPAIPAAQPHVADHLGQAASARQPGSVEPTDGGAGHGRYDTELTRRNLPAGAAVPSEPRPSRGRRHHQRVHPGGPGAQLYLLTTRGRKTGRPRTNPVTVVEHHGKGGWSPVSWVHNARAAGRVSLRRRLDTRECAVREVSASEAEPVLKQYVRIASATRPYSQAAKDSGG
jgi:deazaflavin-dependent oxidoreductase (nitroreductase family)